ncbi:MAG TPA: methylmalonyl-CoA epimerase [Thermoleophilaceae bacterium]
MLFGRIDHIGVAVADLDAALELYAGRFDMTEQRRETVEEQGVEAVLLEVGEGHVELLSPLSEDTAVGKFLAKRGPGLHHVAYQTDDIERTLETVREAGLKLIDRKPRAGIGGSRVAFLHPKATGGVLTELVEPAH